MIIHADTEDSAWAGRMDAQADQSLLTVCFVMRWLNSDAMHVDSWQISSDVGVYVHCINCCAFNSC